MATLLSPASDWAKAHHYVASPYRAGQITYPSFSPERKTGSALYGLYGKIVSKAIEDIERTILLKLKRPSESSATADLALCCLRKEIVHSSIREWSEQLSAKSTERKEAFQQKMQRRQITKLSGLAPEELPGITKIAKQWAINFFDKDLTFSYADTRETINKWSKDCMVHAQNFFYGKLAMQRSKEPVTFTDEDLQAFEIQREAATANPQTISCMSFALLQAREKQAMRLIFEKGANDRDLKQILQKLAQWNYTPVEEPAPGDLVVYIDQNDNPEHVGVYLGDDKVRSKIGIANPYSHVHRLFAVDDKALFFRKRQE